MTAKPNGRANPTSRAKGLRLETKVSNRKDGDGAAADPYVAALVSRMLERMDALGWGNSDLSRAYEKETGCALPLATLTGWFKGKGPSHKIQSPQLKHLLHISRVLNVEDRWLFSGEGRIERRAIGGNGNTSDPNASNVIKEMENFAAGLRKKYAPGKRVRAS